MGSFSSAILSTPKFDLKLPTSGKRVEYRPFLVKEEKTLLIASESKSERDMYMAMRDIIAACTFNKIDVEKMPIVDLEYVFLKIRSKSVGETAKPLMPCKECKTKNEIVVNLNEVEPVQDAGHTSKIDIGNSIIVEMRYPTYEDVHVVGVAEANSDIEQAFGMISVCIDKIHTPNETFNVSDLEQSEINDFVGNLTQNQFGKLTDFFKTMPHLHAEVPYKCSKCNHEESVQLRSLRDFF